MLKRDGATLTQAAITFKYPSVALDHSIFVSGVTCSAGTLTGVLTDVAYKYAKQKWATAGDIVFITSADGCGVPDQNDYFHATSVSFTDSTNSFTAIGDSPSLIKVASHVSVRWGALGTTKLRRSIDKSEVRYNFVLVLHFLSLRA
jgi:hypothetical protein